MTNPSPTPERMAEIRETPDPSCTRCEGRGKVNGSEWLGTGYEQRRCPNCMTDDAMHNRERAFLLGEISRLRADAERWQYCLERAGWHRGERDPLDYMTVPVLKGADLSCIAFRREAVDAARASRVPSGAKE